MNRPYQVKDIAGQKFGLLTALSVSHVTKRGAVWSVICDCGRDHKVVAQALLSGNTKSCGCRGGKHSPYGMMPIERVMANITAEPNSGCWLWLKAHNRKGYGTIGVPGRKNKYVHRLTYEHFVGPIPEGLVLDHKCRVPLCCNPQHLRPMTIYENAALGNPNAWQKVRTACPQGHPYAEHSRMRAKGGRLCLLCAREAGRRRDAKLKALRQKCRQSGEVSP
jgi:hypothetical protein